MKREEAVRVLREDPVAQRLLTATFPARLAYTALDGTPRAIPVAFHFDGHHIIVASPDQAPKVAAMQENPAVALTIDTDTPPPDMLLVRGTCAVDFVDGVVPEFLTANRRMIPAEHYDSWVDQVTAVYDRMARIEIAPTWARAYDFETRIPQTVEELARRRGLTI